MGKKQLPEEFKEFIQCLNKNNVISINDLIINKKTSARSMDIADAEKLDKQIK
jgi:hypothetical protein